MLRNVKNLQKAAVLATDGAIGHVSDLYFDDEQWTIRYFVVDAASWTSGRAVLVSPLSVRRAGWGDGKLHVSLTRDQVKHSPDIDLEKPVSRQQETEYLQYYNYPFYWGSLGVAPRFPARHAKPARGVSDPHLRSTREVLGYHVQAKDGELGHVDDFLVDDANWMIRYAVIDTSNWWLGKRVVIPPEWIDDISWERSKVTIDMARQMMKEGPAYTPEAPVDRQWEAKYYAHHRRDGYWAPSVGEAAEPLVSLNDHREFEVAVGQADPRGWTVVAAADGQPIGKVDDLIVDSATKTVRYLDVEVESDAGSRGGRRDHILLPATYARISSGEHVVNAQGLTAKAVKNLPSYRALPVPTGYDEAFRQQVT